MSKEVARKEASYRNEALVLALLPALLEQHGFSAVVTRRQRGMKFVDAMTADGSNVRFWLKQGWTDTRNYSAIQFGLFDVPGAAEFPDSFFFEHVDRRVANAKSSGATHALLVHMVGGEIVNYVALEVDDVAVAFRRQIAKWPKRARNTKTPTLYFEDSRNIADADVATAVAELELPLSNICGITADPKGTIDVRKVTAEIEMRMRQQTFRLRVGDRCGWRCVVTGTAVKEVLDAAHLPGKNWRTDNRAEDGILLRSDLHRLLDCRVAELRDGKFWLAEGLRRGDYAPYHNKPIAT